MKICFLGDSSSIHVKRWCEFFRDMGDEVTLISFSKEQCQGIKNISLADNLKIDNKGGNIGYLKKIFIIKKIIKDINPDIVNAHYLTSYGLIGAITKARPLVVSTWGTDILVTPYKNPAYLLITKYVIKKSDLITSDSKFMSDKIRELGGSKKKIATVPMGIDTSIFNSTHQEMIKNYGEILSMRTLIKNSNIDIIIKAFSKLVREDKKIRLNITNDGDCELELKNLVNQLGINEYVKFYGNVKKEEVAKLLKKSDLYISIPTSDSTSVTLLEAMACGTLPIVSKLPANEEWIKNKKNGYVVNGKDQEELYKIMEEALQNQDLKAKAAALNKTIINKRAIWKENMNSIREEYMKIL